MKRIILQLYVYSKTNEKFYYIKYMIVLIYILISHYSFAVMISQGDILTDKSFFEALLYSYCWPYDLFINSDSNRRFDKLSDTIAEYNEKFRNFLYFALFGIDEEFSN